MKQSMSRVAKCIDNGPMEGFWGILKRERYYGKRFTSREELVQMIENYIVYYNNRRVQRNLGVVLLTGSSSGLPGSLLFPRRRVGLGSFLSKM